MSLIQNFEKFLTVRRIIPESRINFYMSWVTQCLAFLDKSEKDEITSDDINRFLNHLAKFKEDFLKQMISFKTPLQKYLRMINGKPPPND
jgi:hypothetical protein